MTEYSFETLYILSIAKLIMFFGVAVFLWLVFKGSRPRHYIYLFGAAIFLFYLVLSYTLQKMWWGNNGDEVFIFAYLTKVLHSGFSEDFYYSGLPNFYPPLYFWITGAVASLFTMSGIVAAKIGVLLSTLSLFFGFYWWQRFFWRKIFTGSKTKVIVRSEWFFVLIPVFFFLMIDFDSFVLKPFEAISAIFSAALIGMLSRSFELRKWNWQQYLFFGLSGSVLFLTFYFWWFMLIPALLIIVLMSKYRLKSFTRISIVGTIIAALSAIYLVPLILSLAQNGMENWQAVFFTPKYLFSFLPWEFSFRGIFYIVGLFGLLFFSKNKFIQANLIVFVVCYLYQFINIFFFTFGGQPLQPIKSFLYLVPATLAIGATYSVLYLFANTLANLKLNQKRAIIIGTVIISLPLMPFGSFIEEPVVLYQIEEDQTASKIYGMSVFIKNNITNYKKINWISSGTPDLNAYIPISYYLAHNPHFSHPASMYSARMANIKGLLRASGAGEFAEQARNLDIAGLILYNDSTLNYYPLFFWADNYPNAGKEIQLKLDKNLITDAYWDKVYDKDGFMIYLSK